MSFVDGLLLTIKLSLRSLWSHKVKSLIVGSLIAFGTLLVVTGTALLDSVESAMSRSIIHSLAAHLQVYSADSRDKLEIYGGMAMGAMDVEEVDDFSKIKAALKSVPNVKAVLPMGIELANMTQGSDLDEVLAEMRQAHRDENRDVMEQSIPRLKRIVTLLRTEMERRLEIADEETRKEVQANIKLIDGVLADEFWANFRKDPLVGLEHLDTRIAPFGGDGRPYYLRYVGTDLDAFAQHFDRFRLVEGEKVPTGKRGMLINQKFADTRLKIIAARLFDDLFDGLNEGLTIVGTPELGSKARRLATQSGAIGLALDPSAASNIADRLRAVLPSNERDLDALLKIFLAVNDENFDQRHRFFYEELAPHIQLYPFRIGDIVTLRTFSRRGYGKSLNVKVYGTFTFKGLERSDLSGAANLVDMMTFRDLYGQMSEAQRSELKSIRDEVGVRNVGRDNAEADLFGSDSIEDEIDEEEDTGFSEFAGINIKRERRSVAERPLFSQEQIDQGMVISAAIMLEDEDRLSETQEAVKAALKKAGLKMNVVDWKEASGFIGKLATVIRVVLYVAIFIIFAVALVIINNSMLMATMERVREIGTLRAIGAQRLFVMAMFMLETLVLGLVSGGLGALLGAAIILWLGVQGIPATSDVLVFVFSGPALHPTVEVVHIMLGMGIIIVVSLLATYYPARIATRIQPIEAMQSRD